METLHLCRHRCFCRSHKIHHEVAPRCSLSSGLRVQDFAKYGAPWTCAVSKHHTPSTYLAGYPREAGVPRHGVLDAVWPAGCAPWLRRGQRLLPLPPCVGARPPCAGHSCHPGLLPWRSRPQTPLQGSKPQRRCRPGKLPATTDRCSSQCGTGADDDMHHKAFDALVAYLKETAILIGAPDLKQPELLQRLYAPVSSVVIPGPQLVGPLAVLPQTDSLEYAILTYSCTANKLIFTSSQATVPSS